MLTDMAKNTLIKYTHKLKRELYVSCTRYSNRKISVKTSKVQAGFKHTFQQNQSKLLL